MLKQLGTYLIILILPVFLFAQGGTEKKDKDPLNAAGIGVYVHTFGIGVEIQYFRKMPKFDLWVIANAASQKSLKEQRILSAYTDRGGEDYIWDKKNYFYKVFLGAGISKQLVQRTQHNKVGIRLSVAGGPVIGLLKPYYVEVVSAAGEPFQEVQYDASVHTWFDIYGEGDYFLGIEEIKAVPGFSLKVSSLLDFSKTGNYIRGIEVGLYGDIFTKRVELFDELQNPFIFGGASVMLLIGNAW